MPLPYVPSNLIWYRNRLGRKIVENYENSARDRARSGACYQVTYDRIQVATQQVGDGRPLPPVDPDNWGRQTRRMFYALWGSHIKIKKWLEIPEDFRGCGAPGAMVGDGRGDALMLAEQIWSGRLEPGAVFQTWKKFSDYILVIKGEEPKGIGHSFILKEYVYKGNSIVGMKVIDNGHHGTATVTRGSWGYWVATNVRCLGAGATPRIPDPWWPKETTEGDEAAEPAETAYQRLPG